MLEELDPSRYAFFFDFDGTLAAIVDDPLAVKVSDAMRKDVADLYALADGAVAIVSGRSVEQLRLFLAPAEFPLSGVHGQQLRDIGGAVEDMPYNKETHAAIASDLRAFASDKPGIIVETKPGAVALHFRMAPERAPECEEASRSIVARYARVHLLRGKMVNELKLGARTKGDAVRTFMARPPFLGRRPIFFGDDVTDEFGFEAAQELDGIGVKIGDGNTIADRRFDDLETFHGWLAAFVAARASRQDDLARRTAEPLAVVPHLTGSRAP